MNYKTQSKSEQDTKAHMDRMYRWTRHVYDFSRKYYLLGRDCLINDLDAKADEHIYEVGCGTARNLIKAANRYPAAHFYGLDASEEMLKTARVAVDKSGEPITLQHGFSQSFVPENNLAKIFFSYSLSIIPPWQESIDHALALLPSGGEIHIVDFGAMDGLPSFLRRFIFGWLKVFHVYHKPEILAYLKTLAEDGRGTLEVEHLYRGYSFLAKFVKA